MGWYDTFRTTKINYYLLVFALAIGPLIYFYVKSVIQPRIQFRKIDWLHFLPVALVVVIQISVFLYDQSQAGFDQVQNGVWMEGWYIPYFSSLHGLLNYIFLILYLAFAIQMYFRYRKNLLKYFSNTYTVELNWLRNFLLVYSFVILFSLIQDFIDMNIMALHWTQSWWVHFISACAMVYLGIYGYFTKLEGLEAVVQESDQSETASFNQSPIPEKYDPQKLMVLEEKMVLEKPYLKSDLTLNELARLIGISSEELSILINEGKKMNFNEYINTFRVNTVKEKIKNGEAENLSLLGIAFDAGFNSKATFNRTFKKLTGKSPSDFYKSIQ
jgi:AraC-like DNA-binding protein